MSSDNAKKIPPLRAVPEKDAGTPALPFDSSPEDALSDAAPSTCVYCYGAGMEVVAGKGARRCRCREQGGRTKMTESARIPRRYDGCSLQNYFPAPNNGTQLKAFNYAFRLVREYPAVDRGLLFMGTVGVGKTHLSVAILRGLMEKGVPCMFSEFGALLKQIQDSYNPISKNSEMRVLAPVYQAEV
ncbi:MAG TPA: hypothetical protein VF634_08700, partial [Pyrinomonadaceae bacterium]